jgi:hypothetical protein
MPSRRIITGTLAVAAAAAVLMPPTMAGAASTNSASRCPLPTFGPGGATYHPRFDPAGFSSNVTNRYFPLKVGRTLVYTGVKDGKAALNLVVTTSRTRVIDHVTTRVVEDRLYLDNVLEERTSDYYAQDACGNVWYFGEDTATLDSHGHVISTEGSFHAGVAGAQPGVFMQAHPTLGRQFRQEWFKGQAEDTFKVISLDTPVKVPAGSFRHALRTAERTDLEPGVLDNKYYVTGIGEVVEAAVRGPAERLQLVEIIS